MRLQRRPRWRGTASVRFAAFESGVGATRALSQAGLFPSNCRLLDGGEAMISAGTGGVGCLLVLGFESADHPVSAWMDRALELCRDHGGDPGEGARVSDSETEGKSSRQGAAGTRRSNLVPAPHTRGPLIRIGLVGGPFRTPVPPGRVDALPRPVQ